jgi:hypothetical protein
MMYSVVETAKVNHVNVRCYLQYLLKEISKHFFSWAKASLRIWCHVLMLTTVMNDKESWLMNVFCRGYFLNQRVREPRGKGIQWFIHLLRYIKMTNYQLAVQPNRFRSSLGAIASGAVVRVQVSKVPKIRDFRDFPNSQCLSPDMILTCQSFYKETLIICRLRHTRTIKNYF